MPKAKTHSGAKKRVNVTGGGKIKRSKAFISHNLTTGKTKKQKNDLHNPTYVSKVDMPKLKALLGL